MSKQEHPTTTPHNVVCLWHANCMDGQIAAAITHRYFGGQVECRPVRYNEAPPLELIEDKHVYLVDFTYPPEVLVPHIPIMKSLTIIDHHSDAVKPWLEIMEERSGNSELVGLAVFFDNNKSGAMLAWDYFFGNNNSGRTNPLPPILVQYAQEYDLWTKRLPMTDEVQSGLRFSFPPHEANLDKLADVIMDSSDRVLSKFADIGLIINKQEKIMAESLIRRGLHFTKFLDYENIPVCAIPAELANQAGEIIYTRYPEAPFVVLFEDNYKYKSRKYSFRSRRDGGANVSQIASRLGGKGHYNSSGAVVDLELVFEANATHDIIQTNN